MIFAKKVRLHPTPEQEQKMWQSVGTARFVYNWTLNRQEENYKNGGKFISDNVLRKEITQLKKGELSWLSQVSNNVAKQAVKDCCKAYKNFFDGRAKKPRFKSRKKSKASFYNDNVALKVKENSVLIEKIGWVKTSEQIQTGVKYTNPRISHDGKYWYLSVGTKQELNPIKLTDYSLGIDVGVKDLAVCSNGQVFKNINKSRTVKKLEKRLKRLQRQVSRKYEMNKQGNKFIKTKNIIKLEHQIKLIYRRLTNIRNNHLHQATSKIVKTKPSRIVIEDLNVSGMMKNKHLSKAIQQQKLYEFRRQLEYKTKKYGIELVLADRWYPSSKTCYRCGTIKSDLKLKDRVFKCACGYQEDRDLNAALNLSAYEY